MFRGDNYKFMSANYINNTGIQENHLHAYCGKPFSSSNWDHEILDPRYSAQQDPDWIQACCWNSRLVC
jgi:hypothetical protein